MTEKKQFQLKTLESTEVDPLNRNLDQLYRNKLESITHTDTSATVAATFQYIESGEISVSATGSPSVTTVVTLQKKPNKLLYVGANAEVDGIVASVHNVTGTSISVSVRAMPVGTASLANISDVTTASFSVRWMLMGSSP